MNRGSRSQEKLNWGMQVVIARFYTDNLREEVVKGMNEKIAQGWLPGTPPLGYRNVVHGGKRIQVIDPDVAPLIRKLFELYATGGYSLRTLAVEAEQMGVRTRFGRPLAISHLNKMLRHPYYIGKLPWDGKIYDGAHEPLISVELFEKVQDLLSGRRNYTIRRRKHSPLFQGLFRCEECDGMITWELHKGRYYGRCKGDRGCTRKKYARQDEVEAELMRVFDKLICPSPAILAWVVGALKERHARDMDVRDATVNQMERRKKDLARRLDLIYEDRLDGRIDADEYDRRKQMLVTEQAELERRLANQADDYATRLEQGLKVLELTQNAAELYQLRDTLGRRAIIGGLFTNLTLNGKDIKAELTPLVEAISETARKHRELVQKSELSDDGVIVSGTNRKEALTRASRSLWLGRQDSNLRMTGPKPVALPLGDDP
jgi:site-specific DNA recombinase